MDIVSVALFTPLRRVFDYLLPEALQAHAPAPGQRVMVPFGRAQRIGIALERKAGSELEHSRLKPIEAVLDAAPVFDAEALALAQWAAAYYQHPLGDVLGNMLPVWLRRHRDLPVVPADTWALTEAGAQALAEGRVRASRQRQVLASFAAGPAGAAAFTDADFAWRTVVKRLVVLGLVAPAEAASVRVAHGPAPELNAEQLVAAEAIIAAADGFRAVLLQGVTGSGKTEVYLAAIGDCLARDRQALVLVPEIALTEQLVARFRRRFGEAVGVLHSGLGERERMLTWSDCASGRVRILIGTRSAVWARLPQLGLIVVDEEHDPSYKQQDGFRYSARDIALVRAQNARVPVVLGSATPSLETLANVERGKYLCTQLRSRAGSAPMPAIECLDVRGLELTAGMSPQLVVAIGDCLARGEQVMLFLNRRGYSPLLICRHCGEPKRCDRCDAFLVYHKGVDAARCHHCDRQWSRQSGARCCEAPDIALMGLGTERIEEAVAELFPTARLCRIDRDTVRRKDALRQMLDAINTREVDIVIGTQMLAKGLDFSAVTLVGVVDADSRLYSLDFRAEERLAQLLIQVAGRAGRADLPGRVLVQTHQPHHPVLRQIIDDGYEAYAATALAQRREAALPPYGAMAILRAESTTPSAALKFLGEARRLLLAEAPADLDLSYPLPAMMERRAGRYRALMVMRAAQRFDIGRLLRVALPALDEMAGKARVRPAIDVDPQDTL
ncbi:MAG: primosomal protein N' [Proteobacteria bacterium]|nr:primosomal protein N' [Pseudomonadota bacterium]